MIAQPEDQSPDRMQRLLNHAVWDDAAASTAVRDFVVGHLGDQFAVAVFDESAQEKKGSLTAGVKRQYAGCVGKVTNAVNMVYCTYASPRGHAIIGGGRLLVRVQLTSGRGVRADHAVKLHPADAWNHRSAGPGSKGERRYAWAWLATTSPHHHLLVRRSLSNPTELAYFYTWVPQGRPVTLPTLVKVAGMR